MCRLMGKVVCRVFLMNLCQVKSSALKASRVNRKGSSSQHHPDTSNLQIPCWATHCDPSSKKWASTPKWKKLPIYMVSQTKHLNSGVSWWGLWSAFGEGGYAKGKGIQDILLLYNLLLRCSVYSHFTRFYGRAQWCFVWTPEASYPLPMRIAIKCWTLTCQCSIKKQEPFNLPVCFDERFLGYTCVWCMLLEARMYAAPRRGGGTRRHKTNDLALLEHDSRSWCSVATESSLCFNQKKCLKECPLAGFWFMLCLVCSRQFLEDFRCRLMT